MKSAVIPYMNAQIVLAAICINNKIHSHYKVLPKLHWDRCCTAREFSQILCSAVIDERFHNQSEWIPFTSGVAAERGRTDRDTIGTGYSFFIFNLHATWLWYVIPWNIYIQNWYYKSNFTLLSHTTLISFSLWFYHITTKYIFIFHMLNELSPTYCLYWIHSVCLSVCLSVRPSVR